MDHMDQRRMVVDEALTWLGTPHHHQGRVKGAVGSPRPGGVDCLMLMGEVFHRAGLMDQVPLIEYPPDGHLHHSDELVIDWISRYAFRITEEEALPGDVVLYKYGRRFAHGAIIIFPGWPRIIHAVLRRTVEFGRGDQVVSAGHEPRARMFWRYDGWGG